jgi:TolA-binding protein
MKNTLTVLLLFSVQILFAQFSRGQGLSAKQTQQVNALIATAIKPLQVDIASLKVSVTNLQTQTASFVSQITTLQNQLIITNGKVSDLTTQVTASNLLNVSQQKEIDALKKSNDTLTAKVNKPLVVMLPLYTNAKGDTLRIK